MLNKHDKALLSDIDVETVKGIVWFQFNRYKIYMPSLFLSIDYCIQRHVSTENWSNEIKQLNNVSIFSVKWDKFEDEHACANWMINYMTMSFIQ